MLNIFKNRKLMTMVIYGGSLLGLLLYSIFRPREMMTAPVVLMLLFALISGITAFVQPHRKDFTTNHSSSEMQLFALAGAVLMLIAGVIWLFGKDYVKAAAAILTAGSLVWLSFRVMQHRQPGPVLPILLSAANIAMLIMQFREWSLQPQVGTYVYPLFASFCILLFCYQLLAFCFNIGSRKQAVFCAMFGAFLCISVLMNGSLITGIWFLGWGLFLISEFDNLLFKPRKRRKPKKITFEEETAESETDASAESEAPGCTDELQTLPEKPTEPFGEDPELPED